MNDLIKNRIYEAEIVGYSSEGLGVARIEGGAVFVPRTVKGEKWKVRIVKVTKTVVYGRAEEALSLSEERREPDCEAYLRCGGCTLRHMSYAEEKRFKLDRVNDALKHIARQSVQAAEIIGSDSTERYRNKGIYAIKAVDGGLKSGFFAPRSHELVPVSHCLIQNEAADRVCAAVLSFAEKNGIKAYDEAADRACAATLSFAEKNGIKAYDEETGRGLLRHVYVRCAQNTEDCVACIVSAGGFGSKTSALTEHLRKTCPELTGIVLNINRTRGNTVLDGEFYTLWGSDIMRDSLGGIEYEISPRAFYQINPPQAERLYDRAVEYADCNKDSLVLDMYCGAGTISLYLARTAGKVIGAEIIPEAIENARRNAERNGIKNAEFICADASQAAEHFLGMGIRPEVVVTDPPRKGMDERAIKALCGMSPQRVVYVSCNPSTLARDILVFNACGYELQKATAVDMFPRTSHVETVCLITRAY